MAELPGITRPTKFVSRINGAPSKNHWVARFLREIRVIGPGASPEQNLRMCNRYNDKGPIVQSLSLNIFVDNDERCLTSISTHCKKCELVYYENDKGKFRPPRTPVGCTMKSWDHLWEFCMYETGRLSELRVKRRLQELKNNNSYN